ncbi:hypothetical protein [Streptomyces sp. NPDC050263]|uniref:hypothetical protein n=1 Tax=Streptomyces sp. NPDC050263 TaxID=3155037 RepID=UPI0034301F76
MAAITASVALVGVLGAGGVYGGVFASGKGDGDNLAAHSGSTRQAVSILKDLLPEGKVSKEREIRPSDSFRAYLGGSLVFDDGKGSAAVSVTLDRLDATWWNMASRAACWVGVAGVGSSGPRGTCTVQELADGSQLTLTESYVAPYRDQDPKMWEVELIKPDGSLLTVREWNAPGEQGAEPTRDEPPLTKKKLIEMVTSKKWQATLDSLPRRGAEVEDGASRSDKIRATVAQVAPPGVKVTVSPTGPAGIIEVGVDDGKGRALLEVNIGYGGKENKTGRMRFDEREGVDPWSDEGTLRRAVGAVRPNGFGVVIAVYNAEHVFGKPTRATLPLTMEQLKDMAADAAWDSIK